MQAIDLLDGETQIVLKRGDGLCARLAQTADRGVDSCSIAAFSSHGHGVERAEYSWQPSARQRNFRRRRKHQLNSITQSSQTRFWKRQQDLSRQFRYGLRVSQVCIAVDKPDQLAERTGSFTKQVPRITGLWLDQFERLAQRAAEDLAEVWRITAGHRHDASGDVCAFTHGVGERRQR